MNIKKEKETHKLSVRVLKSKIEEICVRVVFSRDNKHSHISRGKLLINAINVVNNI